MPIARKKRAATRARKLDRAALKAREKAIIADLRAGKLSYRMIAAKHRVSLPTVNAKARKAGITRPRGRRPGVVAAGAGVLRQPPRAAKPRRRGGMRAIVAAAAGRPARRTRGERRGAGARRRPRAVRAPSASAFHEAFREMVLRYFPRISLKQFDRLARLVERATA